MATRIFHVYNKGQVCYHSINGIYTSTCSRYLLKEERTCNGLFFLFARHARDTQVKCRLPFLPVQDNPKDVDLFRLACV